MEDGTHEVSVAEQKRTVLQATPNSPLKVLVAQRKRKIALTRWRKQREGLQRGRESPCQLASSSDVTTSLRSDDEGDGRSPFESEQLANLGEGASLPDSALVCAPREQDESVCRTGRRGDSERQLFRLAVNE